MKTDSELKKDVLAELKWEPSINETDIGVLVKDGVVTLTGHVSSYFQKLTAEKVVKKISGVKAVVEEIEVNLLNTSKKSDYEIAQAAVYALKWNTSVDESRVEIKVEDGWIYLGGELPWKFQKRIVKEALLHLSGVKGIQNDIKTKSTIKPSDIKNKIVKAFERSARIDSNNIEVETESNNVILRGRVASLAEKRDAENAAWSAPGIRAVKNELIVEEPTLV